MNRKPLMAGNWKMYKTADEARLLIRELKPLVAGNDRVDILVCPPFTSLPAVREMVAGSSIQMGAQNLHWEEQGAFTGEVSASMLVSCGCSHVIIGHSERRQYFKEGDEMLGRKIRLALKSPLTPVFCLGESLEQRESGKMRETVIGQMDGALAGLTAQELSRMIIAYEPVWAIGTGRTATPEVAQEVHLLIRERLAAMASPQVARQLRILYGGSVKPGNVRELMEQPDIDGALVGGASLKADSFAAIVNYNE